MPQRIQYAANQAQQALNNIQQIAGSLQQPGQFAGGAQSMFQPGFAGTNPQQIRQEIASDLAYGSANQSQFGNQGQFGMQSQQGMQGQLGSQGQFQQGIGMSGAQTMFQPGFAGTRSQEVRQDIARDLASGSQNQGQFGMQGQSGMQGQFGGQGQFQQGMGGAQAMFQPGFAGTTAQEIRQDIARDLASGSQNQGQFGMQGQSGMQGQFGGQGQFQQGMGGAQAMFQPGFAGTNSQQVRQEIANDLAYGSQNQSQQGQFGSQFGGAQFQQGAGMGMGGAQTMFQPGFAGTRAQEVRQDIARDLASGSQNQGQFGMQGQSGMQGQFGSQAQFQQGMGMGGGASMLQPGFAGTNVQEVRQDIARDTAYGMNNWNQAQSYNQNPSFAGGQSMMQQGFAGTSGQ